MADPTRRQILERLSSGGLAVREIASGLPMSRPAVSKHLRVLRELGLVVETKVGRRRIYELVAEPLEQMGDWLGRLAAAEGARRDIAIAARPETDAEVADLRTRGVAERGRAEPRPAGAPDDGGDRWRSW